MNENPRIDDLKTALINLMDAVQYSPRDIDKAICEGIDVLQAETGRDPACHDTAPDDCQSAAYRFLTACIYSVEEAYRGDEPSITVPAAFVADARLVVERWNAEHPADDDEPITAGWNRENWPESLSVRGITISDYSGSPQWTIDIHVEAEEFSSDGQSIWIANVATRGDVRAFLRGMRIDTKGSE